MTVVRSPLTLPFLSLVRSSRPVTQIVKAIRLPLVSYGETVAEMDHLVKYIVTKTFTYDHQMIKKLTMKSAREKENNDPKVKRLEDNFEMFPEMIAQWLISGRVTMTVKKKKSIPLVQELNDIIGMIFQHVVGKVLISI
jgi:hypothetical protein